MFNIVLIEPEIPQNTGNISRTCSATGSSLHMVRPFGFEIDDKKLKRAGLDYWQYLDLHYYDNLDDFFTKNPDACFYLATTKAPNLYSDIEYKDGDFLVFGKETRGLPETLLCKYPERCVRIPMISDARSLNLSNAVAVLLYEALRQTGFSGLKEEGLLAEEPDHVPRELTENL